MFQVQAPVVPQTVANPLSVVGADGQAMVQVWTGKH